MPADPVPKSSSALWPTEEMTTTTGGAKGGEQQTTMAGEPMETLGVMARAAKPLETEMGAAKATPKSRAKRPVVLDEQAALPESLEGVVRHAVRSPSP